MPYSGLGCGVLFLVCELLGFFLGGELVCLGFCLFRIFSGLVFLWLFLNVDASTLKVNQATNLSSTVLELCEYESSY